jgi:hypothetical protein
MKSFRTYLGQQNQSESFANGYSQIVAETRLEMAAALVIEQENDPLVLNQYPEQ